MSPKTKVGKGRRSKEETVDPSQGGRTVMAQSSRGCRKITALYPCSFISTARAPCDNLAIAERGPYDYPKSLQSSYEFFGFTDHLKSCVVRRISRAAFVWCPCGDCAMLPSGCLRASGLRFKKQIVIVRS